MRLATVDELNYDLLPKALLPRNARIDSMTDVERAAMAPWAKQWIDIGLRTGPADRPTFEAAVRSCYRHSGLPEPKRIVWCSSPLIVAMAAPIAAKILANVAKRGSRVVAVDDAVRGAVDVAVDVAVRGAVDVAVDVAVRGAVDVAVGVAVRGAVRGAVGGAVRGAVDVAVGGAVDDAVRGAVRGAVDDAVRGAVDDAVDAIGPGVLTTPGADWQRYLGGQFWVGWYYYGPAAATFFMDAMGLDLGREMELRARAYAATAQSACWWWPHSDFVMVSERPVHLARDERGRLHCANRAAVEWSDGWGVYAWHGVVVPKEWILDPKSLTAKTALSWKNIEQRRAAAEILGWERILSETGARTIDKDPDPQIGELLEVDLPDAPSQKFLRVRCGTGRQFALPVPPEMKTALAANAWTYAIEDVAGLSKFRSYAVRT